MTDPTNDDKGNDLGDGLGLDPASLARAEAALAALADRYIQWAEADLARLEACMAEIVATPGQRPARLKTLFAIAHDMKGQGTTFDYPQVTAAGNRLCRLIEASPEPGPAAVAAMAELVESLGMIIRQRRSGEAPAGPEP